MGSTDLLKKLNVKPIDFKRQFVGTLNASIVFRMKEVSTEGEGTIEVLPEMPPVISAYIESEWHELIELERAANLLDGGMGLLREQLMNEAIPVRLAADLVAMHRKSRECIQQRIMVVLAHVASLVADDAEQCRKHGREAAPLRLAVRPPSTPRHTLPYEQPRESRISGVRQLHVRIPPDARVPLLVAPDPAGHHARIPGVVTPITAAK